MLMQVDSPVLYTGFRLYGLRIYGLVGLISVILVKGQSDFKILDIWSFRLYGQLYQDKTVDHISEIRCTMLRTWKWQHLTEKCFRLPHDRPMSTNEFRLISATSESSILVSLFPLSSRSLKKDGNVTSPSSS